MGVAADQNAIDLRRGSEISFYSWINCSDSWSIRKRNLFLRNWVLVDHVAVAPRRHIHFIDITNKGYL